MAAVEREKVSTLPAVMESTKRNAVRDVLSLSPLPRA